MAFGYYYIVGNGNSDGLPVRATMNGSRRALVADDALGSVILCWFLIVYLWIWPRNEQQASIVAKYTLLAMAGLEFRTPFSHIGYYLS